MPRGGDRRHHPVRADGDHAIAFHERNRLLPQRAACVRRHRLHDVADEALVLRAPRHEAGAFVAAPHHEVRRRFDFGDLVAINHLAIAGKVEHARAGIAERLPDGEQNGIAEAAAGEHNCFVAGDLGRRSRRAHQHDGLAGFEQGAKIGRTAHLENDRRNEPPLAIDPGAGQRDAFHREPRAVDPGG